jgi:hypothetical protein
MTLPDQIRKKGRQCNPAKLQGLILIKTGIF